MTDTEYQNYDFYLTTNVVLGISMFLTLVCDLFLFWQTIYLNRQVDFHLFTLNDEDCDVAEDEVKRTADEDDMTIDNVLEAGVEEAQR